MKVIVVKNQLEGGKIGLDLLKKSMANGAKTLGLATGSTPVEFYNQIVNSDLDFTDMVSVNLDEYVGLDGSNDQSYRYFMTKHLFGEKPFKENFLPNGKQLILKLKQNIMTKLLKKIQLTGKFLELVKMDTLVLMNQEHLLKLQLMLLTFKKAQSKPTHVSLNQKQMYHVKQFQWDLLQL